MAPSRIVDLKYFYANESSREFLSNEGYHPNLLNPKPCSNRILDDFRKENDGQKILGSDGSNTRKQRSVSRGPHKLDREIEILRQKLQEKMAIKSHSADDFPVSSNLPSVPGQKRSRITELNRLGQALRERGFDSGRISCDLAEEKYKTEMCEQWTKFGSCKFGSNCGEKQI
eukprot:CAMPEP_0170166502 /NCGR_PEP_ID=MMETSP0040_2-20121228/150_1 /TAXON_ID=641309 /ORGANISM="Lotharella oceanica, Strain CCMP622" /LENGTH=171 /DNA_ID=CAMNT_0010404231 /DNA_START=228 /DNA_END=744 /DNA_ORIENTATION=+